jgi:Na+/melibiose symporter-like transporter
VHLFCYNRSTNTLFALNVLIGWVFWGNLMYIPLYFQNVQGMSPAVAGSLLLPLVIAHGCTSGLSGIVISLSGRYKPVINGGAFLWAIGAIAKTFYDQSTPIWIFLAIGVFEGIGVGCSLQPGSHFPFISSLCTSD